MLHTFLLASFMKMQDIQSDDWHNSKFKEFSCVFCVCVCVCVLHIDVCLRLNMCYFLCCLLKKHANCAIGFAKL